MNGRRLDRKKLKFSSAVYDEVSKKVTEPAQKVEAHNSV